MECVRSFLREDHRSSTMNNRFGLPSRTTCLLVSSAQQKNKVSEFSPGRIEDVERDHSVESLEYNILA